MRTSECFAESVLAEQARELWIYALIVSKCGASQHRL